MEARRMLNQDGAVYIGARAVAIPAHTGTTGEPTTRQVVVASDHKSFTLDDGHTYDRLSGTVWAKRYSVDIGTLLVRQAYTEGAELFESLWRSATDPAPRAPEEIAAGQEQFLIEALRARHRIAPWGRPDFSYDLARARDALAGMATDFAQIPEEKLWAVLEHYRRTDAEIAGLSQPVGPDCLTTAHGTCGRCRPVLVWAWIAERRWTHHDGSPAVTYDVPAILAALERIDPDHRNTPGQVLSRVLDEH
ncbi:hypothetical protein ACFYE2_17290 [Kocuria sp. CPCC 205300]|uniref:hypothetical protein n=1 Tax=Kocuria sabuli TaxID=3071448 RepID=UPI0036D90EB9